MADESVCRENVGGPPLSCSAGVDIRPVLDAFCEGWLARPVVAAPPVRTLLGRGVAFDADAWGLLDGVAPFAVPAAAAAVALAVLAVAEVAPPEAAPDAAVVEEVEAAFSALMVSGL